MKAIMFLVAILLLPIMVYSLPSFSADQNVLKIGATNVFYANWNCSGLTDKPYFQQGDLIEAYVFYCSDEKCQQLFKNVWVWKLNCYNVKKFEIQIPQNVALGVLQDYRLAFLVHAIDDPSYPFTLVRPLTSLFPDHNVSTTTTSSQPTNYNLIIGIILLIVSVLLFGLANWVKKPTLALLGVILFVVSLLIITLNLLT